MATTETDSVHEHMNRLRMKMVQQKIANEKERILQRPPTEESNTDELENQARLQQAMLRRQELLDRIRREQLMNEENKRPRTYSARRRYTPSPIPIPPSRRSLPDFIRYNYPDTFRSKPPEMSQTKHVVEHRIVPPEPYNLPPIQNNQSQQPQYQYPPQQQQQQRPIVLAPPPPPQIMQQQPPQIIQAPAPPQIIATNPNPVITNLGGPPPEKQGMFNKADFMEMMMMQNAQMHHMVMQQLMANSLPGTRSSFNLPTIPVLNESQLVAVQVPRTSGTVHHHHYTTAPAPQPEPVINTYTTVPAMDLRGGYPMRGYASAYTSPANYMYQYEDPYTFPGYYTYH